MSLFHSIIPFIIQHEGGYVNHPNDPGGETKYGISARAYPRLNIKDITLQDAVRIYYEDYWEDSWNKLGFPLAACMLDTAVNMGKKRAKEFFDRSDGSYITYIQVRIAKYKEIIDNNPKMKVFAEQSDYVKGTDASPVLKEIFDLISQQYEACVVYGKKTPRQAIADAADAVNLLFLE